MDRIKEIKGEEVLDSRGRPTLSVTVITESGAEGNFQVPSGASTGSNEALELRDADGKGITNALSRISINIRNEIVGMDVFDQEAIDRKLLEIDNTPNKSFLGGNSMIGVSVAIIKAAAASRNIEPYQYIADLIEFADILSKPYLYLNLINGGKHAKTKLSIQEYHIVPTTLDVSEALLMAKSIQDALREKIEKDYPNTSVGDEGGFALDVEDVCTPLDILGEVVSELGYSNKVKFALDVAASSFFDTESGKYNMGGKEHSKEELFDIYSNIINKYSIVSIEDPFNEDDFESFAKLQKAFPDVIIVGDDLTVTNIERLKKAASLECIKGIIIKPNQVGTMTETFETIKYAKENNIKCIISHRSGETNDDFIADLAFASGAFGLKAGALGPKEREVKYNRLAYLSKL